MNCPHLEETSAVFDGAAVDRTHIDSCGECRAFLDDAAQLRESLRRLSFVTAPRRRIAPMLVPAAIVLAVVLFLLLRPRPARDERSAFAGLDGGGRAVITV
ncbi:MAG TPA: hypothetical protein VM733_18330, partial [Thermoanaerobaculia bacterium]|nr:hypothetical protein [Thermoanaerobaculia bacterium]